jgi:hypothetical protein
LSPCVVLFGFVCVEIPLLSDKQANARDRKAKLGDRRLVAEAFLRDLRIMGSTQRTA